MTIDDLKVMLDERDEKIVGRAMDKMGERLEVFKGETGRAPAKTPITMDDILRVSGKQAENLNPGIHWARTIRAITVAAMDKKNPGQVLDEWGSKFEAAAETKALWQAWNEKALGTSILEDGGALVPETFTAEIIPLLKAQAVLRRMGIQTGPLDTYRRQTAAATASYYGELQAATPSQQKFGQFKMRERRLVALTAHSNSLLRRADPRVDVIIREDLLMQAALAEDLNFIRGTGSEYAPKGIRHWTDVANVFAANATVNLSNVRADLIKMIRLVVSANVNLIRPGWIFNPLSLYYLYAILDSNGNAPYERQLDNNQVHGYPFNMTTQIPTNLGAGSDESEVYFGDANECTVGEDTQMQADAFPNGTYYDGSAFQSGINNDETVIRVQAFHDFLQRQAKAWSILTTVTWGN